MRPSLFHAIVVIGASLTTGTMAGCGASHEVDAGTDAATDASAPVADAGSPLDAGSPADADVDTGIVLII